MYSPDYHPVFEFIDWREFRDVCPFLTNAHHQYSWPLSPLTASTFDISQELIYAGNNEGQVAALMYPDLQLYSRFDVPGKQAISNILSCPFGHVICTSGSKLHLYSSGGAPKGTFLIDNEQKGKITSACFCANDLGELWVSGSVECANSFVVELPSMRVLRKLNLDPRERGITVSRSAAGLHNSSVVINGHDSGVVSLYDVRQSTAKILSIPVFRGPVSELQVCNNKVIVGGYSTKHPGARSYFFEPSLRVFDMRYMGHSISLSQPTHIQYSANGVAMATHPEGLLFAVQTNHVAEPMNQMNMPPALCVFDLSHIGPPLRTHLVPAMPNIMSNTNVSVTSISMAPTGGVLALTDSAGSLKLWGLSVPGTDQLNELAAHVSHSMIVPDVPQMKKPSTKIPLFENSDDDNGSSLYSKAGHANLPVMPTPGGPEHVTRAKLGGGLGVMAVSPHPALLSSFKMSFIVEMNYAPQILPASVTQNIKKSDFIGHAPIPTSLKFKRNQKPPVLSEAKDENPDANGMVDTAIRPIARYRLQNVEHEQMDFDFTPLNRTGLVGLENTLPNSHLNPFLQMLYYTPVLRRHVINHLCETEACLMCELNFFFSNISVAAEYCPNEPFQAMNLLRVLRQLPQVTALGLLEPERGAATMPDYKGLMHKFVKYAFEQLLNEDKRRSENLVERLFGTVTTQMKRCMSCMTSSSRGLSRMVHDLRYKQVSMKALVESCAKRKVKSLQDDLYAAFTTVLESSLNYEEEARMWCEQCNTYRTTSLTYTPDALPGVLMLAAATEGHEDYWHSVYKTVFSSVFNDSQLPGVWGASAKRQSNKFHKELRMLPPSVTVCKCTCGKCKVISRVCVGETVCGHSCQCVPVTYELASLVCHAWDELEEKRDPYHTGHLVAQIKVKSTPELRESPDGTPRWYMLNDFILCPCRSESEGEVGVFPQWLAPVIICYQAVGLTERMPLEQFIRPVRANALQDMKSLSRKSTKKPSVVVLTENELNLVTSMRADLGYPAANGRMLCPLDCEFVVLRNKEFDVRPDGRSVVAHPTQYALARVTVLRGFMSDLWQSECKPFMDDYIVTREQVVDYLTRYSGIYPGDLDQSVSTHHLTTLKSTYLKLCYLRDSGFTFLGHGLKKDFYMANLVVPPRQTIDTVEIYSLPNQRKLSLRFLSALVLGMDIQQETHSSNEDALASYMLYKKSRELLKDGNFNDVLSKVYEIGYSLNWDATKIERMHVQAVQAAGKPIVV